MNMLEVKRILVEARETLSRGRCRVDMAVDSRWRRVADCTSPEAVCWCVLGALAKAAGRACGWVLSEQGAGEDASPEHLEAITLLAKQIGETAFQGPRYNYLVVYRWNDRRSTTDDEVLQVFDKAIASLTEVSTPS